MQEEKLINFSVCSLFSFIFKSKELCFPNQARNLLEVDDEQPKLLSDRDIDLLLAAYIPRYNTMPSNQ